MGNDYSLADIASLSNNCNGLGGTNGWVLIILFALIFGNGFWGGAGNAGAAAAGATAATTSDIQRAVDLNSIRQGQADIASDIQRTTYEGIGATKDAAYNNLSEIRDNGALISAGNANIMNGLTTLQGTMASCCCDLKSTVLENRYLDAQNAANINANTTAAMQKVLDAVQQSKIESLQSQLTNMQIQNAVCGIPRVSTYAWGTYPYTAPPAPVMTTGCAGCGVQ